MAKLSHNRPSIEFRCRSTIASGLQLAIGFRVYGLEFLDLAFVDGSLQSTACLVNTSWNTRLAPYIKMRSIQLMSTKM